MKRSQLTDLSIVYVQIRVDKLGDLLNKRGGYSFILACKPTGWIFKGSASSPAPPALHLHAKNLQPTSASLPSTSAANAAVSNGQAIVIEQSYHPVLLRTKMDRLQIHLLREVPAEE
jgi:hypothetical protein